MEQAKKSEKVEKGGVPAESKVPAVVTRKFDGVETRPVSERAVTAAAETAKAMVQARFIVAKQDRRNELDVRDGILRACQRSRFADVARYRKPQYGAKVCGLVGCPKAKKARKDEYGQYCDFVCGPSIRFADEAAKFMGNLDVRQDVTYEDEEQRIVQVSATDLENNLTKSQTVCVKKIIERKKPRQGQEVIGERKNTKNELVYIVRTSDDELVTKEANLCAKARRNLELQLLPQDFIEEGMDEVLKTLMSQAKKDPDAALKAVCDGFATLNLQPSDLENYLGHELAKSSPEEIQELREIFTTIKDGQATWADYINGEGPTEEKKAAGESKLASGRHDHSKKEPKPEPKAEPKKPSEEKPKDAPTPSDSTKIKVEMVKPKSGSRDDVARAATQMLIMLAGGDKVKAKAMLAEYSKDSGFEGITSFADMSAAQALAIYTAVAMEIKKLVGA